jgi:hypothetical protein
MIIITVAVLASRAARSADASGKSLYMYTHCFYCYKPCPDCAAICCTTGPFAGRPGLRWVEPG